MLDPEGRSRARDVLERAADEKTTSISDILDVIRRYKRALLIWIACCVALAFLYVLITPSEYVATASVIMEPRTAAADGTLVRPALIDNALIDSQVQVIKSRQLLQFVFQELNLENDPEFSSGSVKS